MEEAGEAETPAAVALALAEMEVRDPLLSTALNQQGQAGMPDLHGVHQALCTQGTGAL